MRIVMQADAPCEGCGCTDERMITFSEYSIYRSDDELVLYVCPECLRKALLMVKPYETKTYSSELVEK
jgi:hypothetical protein